MSAHIHVHVYIHVALNILCMCACRPITSDPYSRRHDGNWRYRVIGMSVTISRHPSKLKVVQCTLERAIPRLKSSSYPTACHAAVHVPFHPTGPPPTPASSHTPTQDNPSHLPSITSPFPTTGVNKVDSPDAMSLIFSPSSSSNLPTFSLRYILTLID